MPVLMVIDIPGGTTAQYDRANELAGIHGEADAPAGLLSHVVGADEQGLVVADVWESEDAFRRFFETRLRAALEGAGVPPAEPRFYPVHDMIPKGASDNAGVLLVIEPERFTAEEYDALVQTMDAHEGGGERHPGVSHVAGKKADGNLIVVDVWESMDAFDAFAKEQLAPVADRFGQMDVRATKVHNRLPGKVPSAA